MSETEGSLKHTPTGEEERLGISNKRYLSFLWAVVAAVVIYLIVRNISAFGNILLVVLGFGAVVLIHEFGHFIVAKLSDVKVEAFSIGFPPTLAGILRTEEGYRISILPRFFPKKEEGSKEGYEESRLSFTVGKKGKAGETEYRIGIIPAGGFVKMLGQEDIGSVKTSDDPRSYANKPVLTRAAIIATGVTFNAISAMILFMVVFLVGIELPPAVVGGLVPDSPAAHAGLKAGDEIIEIAGKSENLDFSNIQVAAALSDVNEAVSMKVRHEDGSEEDFAIVAKQLEGNPMRLFGVIPPYSLTIAKISDSDIEELHEKTGLLPGDRITSVNGKAVRNYWELEPLVVDLFEPSAAVVAERMTEDGKVELVECQIPLSLSYAQGKVESETDLSHIYSMVPRLRVAVIDTKSGLQEGDIVLAISKVENPTYKEMRDVTIEHEDKELGIQVLRTDSNGVTNTLVVTVVPKRPPGSDRVLIGIIPVLDAEHTIVAKTITVEGGPERLEIPRGAEITAVEGVAVSSFYDVIREIRRYPGKRISIDYRLDDQVAGSVVLNAGTDEKFVTVKSLAEFVPFDDLKRLYKAGNPIDAVDMGFKKTLMFITQTYLTLRRLVSRDVSPKSLIGPVGILAASYSIVAERPFVYYVYFLGLISACIAVVNFLPLPPLDGGVVVLLFVEKVKGSALSERTQGIIAYAGWVLIGGFFLYITFNDIVRSFFS